MERRNAIFSSIKPSAVALSEAVLTLPTPRRNIKSVESRLEALESVIKPVAESSYFDGRLADYVFFPVAQILKYSQHVSLRCLELSLLIVSVLIRYGWRERIEKSLAQQLLILSTLLAGEHPPSLGIKDGSSELQTQALRCLESLLSTAKNEGSLALSQDTNIPQLGQTLSTILDDLRDSSSREVQIAAVTALDSFVQAEWPAQLLWNFLPGIVSTLTKVLRPNTRQRRAPVVIETGLHVIRHILKSLFGVEQPVVPTEQIKEAASQIRTALVSICRLGEHDKSAVRDALCQMLVSILQDCSTTLQDCVQLAIETLITTSSPGAAYSLSVLVTRNDQIKNVLQTTLHDWSTSLVRIMQSADESKKAKRIEQIQAAHAILAEASVDLTTVNTTLGQCLVDGITILLIEPSKSIPASEITAQEHSLDVIAIRRDVSHPLATQDVLGQPRVAKNLTFLVRTMCLMDPSDAFLAKLSRSLLHARGNAASANFWIILTALEARLTDGKALNGSSQAAAALSVNATNSLESAYALALDILNSSSDSLPDTKLQRLALQALAFRAQFAGHDFRFELVDALYPVLSALANPQGHLRQDSISTLTAMTEACGYASVKDLILDNVDYLTNAVALKLNAFDVSPQAPQILLMMVQLAGPSLLPYLEDSVESIFAALEDYHGYPLLVELLFQTLTVMAEQGARAPMLAPSDTAITAAVHQAVEQRSSLSILDLIEIIADRASEPRVSEIDNHHVPEPAPQRPWKPDLEDDDQDAPTELERPGPPAPKTYALLFKITEVTQHFLPAASPSLRLSLLSLICTTIPAISKHEDSFLPLINTLWPEVVSRLDDEELVVRSVALDTIAAFCENARDFMRSRITDLWPRIFSIWQEIMEEASPSVKKDKAGFKTTASQSALMVMASQDDRSIQRLMEGPAAYSNTALRKLWQAFLRMILSIVKHVSIVPEQFDEALDMVKSQLSNAKIEGAFTAHNADAVWLCKLKLGLATESTTQINAIS